MFCGECGVAVAAPKLVEPATKPRPGDTAIIQPLELAPTEFIGDVAASARAARPSPGRSPRVRPKPVPPVPVVTEAAAATAAAAPATSAPAAAAAAAAPTAPEPEHPRITLPPRPAAQNPAQARPAAPKPAPPAQAAARRAPAPDPLPMPGAATSVVAPAAASVSSVPTAGDRHLADQDLDDQILDEQHDLEETRIVAASVGDRFVLQFSTGENSTVYGTGLVGRNPLTQPGEYVDQLVAIIDPGKSVSKTHLEFGQTAGAFWVVDRYSANGTIVRQPDAPPQRLDPGKRQPIARGTRVDMGEQFFVVS